MGVIELRNDYGVLVGVGKSSFEGILCKWGMDYQVKGLMKGRLYDIPGAGETTFFFALDLDLHWMDVVG